jgi:hypothetical protein
LHEVLIGFIEMCEQAAGVALFTMPVTIVVIRILLFAVGYQRMETETTAEYPAPQLINPPFARD